MEDLIRSLQWKIFWQHKDKGEYPVLAQVTALQTVLGANQRCPDQFEALTEEVGRLHNDFREFEKECEAQCPTATRVSSTHLSRASQRIM